MPQGAPVPQGAGYGGPMAGMEFRPGIIPLRPLMLGDLYSAVLKAVRGNLAATVGLACVTSVACLVPTTALGAWIASGQSLSPATPLPAVGLAGSYLPQVGTILASALLTGLLAFVIGQAVIGRRVTADETWEGTRGRIVPLVGAVLLAGLVTLLAVAVILVGPVFAMVQAVQGGSASFPLGPFLLLALAGVVAIVLALWVGTRLMFIAAVVVLENLGVRGAFRRSWLLTGGRPFWRLLGIRLLTALLAGIAAQVATVPLAIIGGIVMMAVGGPSQEFTTQAIVAGVTALVAGSLITPFTAGVDALLYIDQRIRREGLDVQLVAAAQAATTHVSGR